MHDHANHQDEPKGGLMTSKAGFVFLGFLVIGGALLFTEHRAHVLGAVIWLLPLSCIFMHMFMHGGHGGHGGHKGHGQRSNDSQQGSGRTS